MTFARARLWFGISAVGTLVVAAASALLTGAPQRLLPDTASFAACASWFSGIYFLYALLLMPFDFAGGYHLPCRYGRFCQILPVFAWRWARALFFQAAVFILSGTLLVAAGSRWGAAAALAVFVALQLVLLAVQRGLAQLAGGIRPLEGGPEGAFTLSSDDVGFTGGWVGLPGRERLVLPAHWVSHLSSAQLDAILARRRAVLASGARLRGVLLALAWNTLGLALAARLPGAGFASVREFVTTACGFTLWSFLGLLLLPSASRPAVFAADRLALDSGIPRDTLAQVIEELDSWQDDEPIRAPWIERVFHPNPSAGRRVAALHSASPLPTGAWHAARTALYLSWPAFGILSRAVHCNAGRPGLWVILPSD